MMARMRTIALRIDGMTCAGCAGSVQRAITRVPGVRAASVSHEAGRAEVSADDGVDAARLAEAVERAGFAARPAE
jgi:Cu+-exporting ATPase